MTIKAILRKFEQRGYTVIKDIGSEKIIIKKHGRLTGSYNSYNEAYRYYFS